MQIVFKTSAARQRKMKGNRKHEMPKLYKEVAGTVEVGSRLQVKLHSITETTPTRTIFLLLFLIVHLLRLAAITAAGLI